MWLIRVNFSIALKDLVLMAKWYSHELKEKIYPPYILFKI